MKPLFVPITLLLLLANAGCRPAPVIYRTLTDHARQTCDPNQRLRVETTGSTEKAARAAGEQQIHASLRSANACGALITNEGAGSRLDGGVRYVADYQVCRCE